MPPVVFVTAFDAYALKAFEIQAFDYLKSGARLRVTRLHRPALEERLRALA